MNSMSDDYKLELALQLAVKVASLKGAEATPEDVVVAADMFVAWFESKGSVQE